MNNVQISTGTLGTFLCGGCIFPLCTSKHMYISSESVWNMMCDCTLYNKWVPNAECKRELRNKRV